MKLYRIRYRLKHNITNVERVEILYVSCNCKPEEIKIYQIKRFPFEQIIDYIIERVTNFKNL